MESLSDMQTDVPAAAPPAIYFEPSLQIQRQAVVHDILKAISSTPRFTGSGEFTRLFDVGCGDGQFMRRLIPCDDQLPLGSMTGIDIDDARRENACWESLGPNRYYEPKERWYDLDLKLLIGSFESLEIKNIGYHDVIVSFEVVEHLDPAPLSQFDTVLLGKLKPKVCIITTPNRDFNPLFDYLNDLNTNGERQEGYHRDGIPYRLRHHDHRFEWSRQEFRTWALKAARRFGYDVEFSGVGGLGRGLTLEGGGENAGEIVQEAANACDGPGLMRCPPGESSWESLKEIVCGIDDNAEGTNDVRRVFGDCTQIAVFVIKPEIEKGRQLETVGDNELQPVVHHHYPCQDEEYPPSLKTILEVLMDGRLLNLVPELILQEWCKDDNEYLNDSLYRQKHGGLFAPGNPAWAGDRWGSHDDKKMESLLAKTGCQMWEVKAVEAVISEETLWEKTYELQRACHFKYELFSKIIGQEVASKDGPRTLIDTTDCRTILPMKVSARAEKDLTVVAAHFPVSIKEKEEEPRDTWANACQTGMLDKHEYLHYESGSDFEDYIGRGSDNVSAKSKPEFDTTIEWVVSDGIKPPGIRLPQSTKAEGTLVSREDKDGKVFRVRIFGPQRDVDLLAGKTRTKSEEETSVQGTWWQVDEAPVRIRNERIV